MSRSAVSVRVVFVALLLLLTVHCTAWSKTVFVSSSTGNDSRNGLSWPDAKKTIKSAISIAYANDEIWVAKGTYIETFTVKAGVRLYGGFTGTETTLAERPAFPRPSKNPNASVLDGNGSYGATVTAASGATNTTIINGFTIRNSSPAISCASSSPLICNNLITNCRGGGINCSGATAAPTIRNNIIRENSGNGAISFVYSSGGRVYNNFIVGNSTASADGGVIYCYSQSAPEIFNNTIVGNAAVKGGGICCVQSSPKIYNNIIAFNSSGIYASSSTPDLKNNCVYNPDGTNYIGLTAGPGDISEDPKLVSPYHGQVHIQQDSPCIDKGLYGLLLPEDSDIDGQTRIAGAQIDIGADESDGTTWPGFVSEVIRVSPTGNDQNDGSSWTSAKRTIQAAINEANAVSGEVWVAGGIYRELVNLLPYVTLYGGFAGVEDNLSQRNRNQNKTVIYGTGKGSAVSIYGGGYRTTTLDGFTITGGASGMPVTTSGGVYISGSGGTVSNNVITGNFGEEAGGIYCSYSFSLITNNVIKGNTSTGKAGGMYILNGAPVISGNTIAANSGKDAGGICVGSGSMTLANNLIAFNSSGIVNYSITPTLRNNCVYNPAGANYTGLSAGAGDISADPKVASVEYGNFHIQPDSPCIDAGWNDAPGMGLTDIDGQPRKQALLNPGNAIVDIGADESDGTTITPEPAVIKVSFAGNDNNDGLSWQNAKKTVQAGIDTAMLSGGEVWVAAGIHYGRIELRPFIQLYGGFAGTETDRTQRNWTNNQTILDGQSTGMAWSNSESVVRIRTGTANNAVDGFVIRAGAGTQLSDNDWYGGGILCEMSSPVISNNLFMRNTNGAIYCSGGSPVITNNVFTVNTSFWSGIIDCVNSSAVITNNTMALNSTYSKGAINILTSSPKVSNNVVAFNTSGISKDYTSAPTLRNNCVYNPDGTNYSGLTAGQGDISVDPGFASLEYGRLYLQSNSPCIDAGWSEAPGTLAVDFDLQPRIQENAIDIGADESDGTTWSTDAKIIYVSPTGNDSNDGSTWQKAKVTVQAGVDAASRSGGEVWVAKGIYYETLIVGPFAHLYGGFAGTETERSQRDWKTNASILDGNAEGIVVWVDAGNWPSRIDGFTIRNGSTITESNYSFGGGIYRRGYTTIISNNKIIANDGEGIEVGGASIISNNTIRGNSTGISCSGTETVHDNDVSANFCGISCNSSDARTQNITNNTVIGNETGISCGQSTAIITNNIVAFNASGISGSSNYKLTLRNNCVFNPAGANYQQTLPGEGDINTDPLIESAEYGLIHVRSDSPCIDSGLDSAAGAEWVDIDGQTRKYGIRVDIGADEYDGAQSNTAPAIVMVRGSAGSDTNDGLGWNSAKATIQAAIDTAAEKGGEVWVAADRYRELIRIPSFVYVYGGFNGNEENRDSRNSKSYITTIDGEAKGTVVLLRGGFRVNGLDGFTVCNGKGDASGGVHMTRSSIVCNNIVTGNESGPTGGAITAVGNSIIKNNQVTNNISNGIYFNGGDKLQIIGNTVNNNTGTGIGGGIGLVSSNVVTGNGLCGIEGGRKITGNLVSGNLGGGIKKLNTSEVSGNTIESNKSFGIRVDTYDTATILDNTIRNNLGPGISWLQSSGGSISKNRISGNTRGIFCVSGNGTVVANDVFSNNEQGIYCQSFSGTITRNTIRENLQGGIYIDSYGTPTVTNNLIKNNGRTTSTQGGIYCQSAAKIVNNTIVGNRSYSVGGGIRFYTSYKPVCANNIVAFNSSGIYCDYLAPLQNNCVYNPGGSNYGGVQTPGVGDISLDPKFVDVSSGDYHLGPQSPCANAGLNTASGIPAVDMDGEARIIAGIVDIGADEMPALFRIKTLADNSPITVKGAIVTACFDDCFYVEADNRSCGIKIMMAGYTAVVGTRVDVDGIIGTDVNGERYIAASAVTQNGTGNVSPLYTQIKHIGGGDWQFDSSTGSGQSGVNEGHGLSNIGMLVKVSGRVVETGENSFTLSESDGTVSKRLQVIGPAGVIVPQQGSLVIITGICSCIKQDGVISPVLRVRTETDIQALQ